ncbi:MAG: deoxyribodipyrimidine photolyase [Bacteroidetes bacterium SW_11_64_17]|nr:MAG: deoxyribodipyrimidine photolyase [Bacteroidetes bacterium SW_11_64_17]
MSTLASDRVQPLNDRGLCAEGRYVLYWMQQSQRAQHNPALERALRHANEQGLPLLVVFGLMDDYPEANLRHYTFMLEGLRDTQQRLAKRGLRMVVAHGRPGDVALDYADDAALLVTDRGYLRHQKQWRARVAERAPCRVEQVEGDVVVPVETVTDKAEYAARTIRPKIHEHLERCLNLPDRAPVEHPSRSLGVDDGLSLDDIGAVTDRLDLDRSVAPVSNLYPGGASEAEQILDRFLGEHLDGYDGNRKVRSADGPDSDIESYIEELVVRRELAMNHVHFRPDTYDAYECLPEWARESLAEHADDEREHVYSRDQLEQSETHDPYWNAAMKEMRETGYMHNYMRMYWGKKVLEWSPDPQTAFERTLHLNNTYFLDGRDPNSFANVAWIFGLHDRGWKERPVYGKVRYMSQGGLERKADPDAYVEKVDRLAASAQPA